MSEVWVVNASPLIVLGKIDALDLLTRLAPRILIPDPVREEIEAGPESDPAVAFVQSNAVQHHASSPVSPSLEQWGLGRGETSVIATALGIEGARCVLDDALARRAARTFQRPVIGTLGIVLRAGRQELICDIPEVIARMQRAGLYVDQKLIRTVLEDLDSR